VPRKRRRSLRLRAVVLAIIAAAILGWVIYSRRQPGDWQHVFATREGDVGSLTASQTIIGPDELFVALPDRSALGRQVEVRYGNRSMVVPVIDVGPWNIADPYWERDARPASESGHGFFRRPTNRAGIDLSDALYAALGLRDNDYVDWRFVHRDYIALPFL
jgi:hypothetical protein